MEFKINKSTLLGALRRADDANDGPGRARAYAELERLHAEITKAGRR